MGDTGSERSKPPGLPPRCSCGFWGSSKTMNLCSKCFADVQKKQPDEDSSPGHAPSTSSNQSDGFTSDMNSSSSSSPSFSSQTVSNPQPLPSETTNVASLPSQEEWSVSEGEESPGKRARLQDDVAEESRGGTKQRSRRRCYRCQTKLELVQQELGSCRCGYVFCMLHRLPEQHDCLFDHLGRGREEAILKMVKLDRKVGRSCQRIGEECS
ncbi:AN1-type zinc finger protein 3 isoform X2 [Acipenser ruthenus]|uniref:AN1-type zinc finger protein 3 isoform X2 n=1 Tax=Acipenser ruthenus TaxID=7906 RepID=UPI0027425FAF|nr:AN1-type zinc finger protein 3 isoform X2 [Acipenser ruthenus]